MQEAYYICKALVCRKHKNTVLKINSSFWVCALHSTFEWSPPNIQPLRKKERAKSLNEAVTDKLEVAREGFFHGSRWFMDQVADQKLPNI